MSCLNTLLSNKNYETEKNLYAMIEVGLINLSRNSIFKTYLVETMACFLKARQAMPQASQNFESEDINTKLHDSAM